MRAQIGRSWSDVYGDICRRYPKRGSYQNQEVHKRLMWTIELEQDVYLAVDGEVYSKRYDFKVSTYYAGMGWTRKLYVHPETGILCESRRVPSAQRVTHRAKGETAQKRGKNKADTKRRHAVALQEKRAARRELARQADEILSRGFYMCNNDHIRFGAKHVAFYYCEDDSQKLARTAYRRL